MGASGLEVLASGTLLPLIALGVLHLQLSQFGELSAVHKATMASAALGVFVFGLLELRNISEIRRIIADPT